MNISEHQIAMMLAGIAEQFWRKGADLAVDTDRKRALSALAMASKAPTNSRTSIFAPCCSANAMNVS
jgi:hypothetical protein